jgi:hypothetical protein
MRKVIIESTLLIALVAVVTAFILMPANPQMLVYPLVRQAAQTKLDYETRDMAVYNTPHFAIRYRQQDADTVEMVAQAAEKAYEPVVRALGFSPAGKTLIVIYPDRQELNKAFGWSGDQSAMGAYWGGVIQVLSPQVWLKHAGADEFIRSGPMVHEFTHLVFDHMTRGNYPRWFTEGLAQYVEFRVNNYEWRTANNSLQGRLYTMAELDGDFDSLANQALAYRQSLAAVRYIAEAHGDAKLHEVIANLQAGRSMADAISGALGMSYGNFETAWTKWAVDTMK